MIDHVELNEGPESACLCLTESHGVYGKRVLTVRECPIHGEQAEWQRATFGRWPPSSDPKVAKDGITPEGWRFLRAIDYVGWVALGMIVGGVALMIAFSLPKGCAS